MQKDPASRILNIVFVGSFNPAIFSPMWFAAKNIISEKEALDARIELIHPEFSRFEVSDCLYEIHLNRFVATTKHSHLFEKLQDNVINIFNHLRETPIYQVGINWYYRYEFLDSEKESYVNFGHLHVPKSDFWDKHLTNPGLQDMKIQATRVDNYNGVYNVSINKSQTGNYAIDLHFNDHYELKNEEKVYDSNKAIEIIEKNYSSSRDFANKLLIEVFNYGTK